MMDGGKDTLDTRKKLGKEKRRGSQRADQNPNVSYKQNSKDLGAHELRLEDGMWLRKDCEGRPSRPLPPLKIGPHH